jgi:anti-sigma regulatory factor (Ser/Thr protein kinase)
MTILNHSFGRAVILKHAHESGRLESLPDLHAFGEVLPQQPVDVLVTTPLPRALGVAEVGRRVSMVNLLCAADSSLRSQVSVRSRSLGRSSTRWRKALCWSGATWPFSVPGTLETGGDVQHTQAPVVAVLRLERDGQDLGRARRLVTEQLREMGHDELVDDAVLAVCEVATNALIHTDGSVEVRVSGVPALVRVAVDDDSPIPPVAGVLDDSAMCGRGLVLLSRLTTRWGITPRENGGKRVWFELEPDAEPQPEEIDADALLDFWDLDELARPDVVTVRVPGVRAELLYGAKSHLDDLVRECALVAQSERTHDRVRDDVAQLAVRLTDLAVRLTVFRNQVRRQAVSAGYDPDQVLTLELTLPVDLADALVEYRDVLDEVDELARQGVLLTALDVPRHQEFRRWKIDRVVEQLRP